MIWLFTLSCQEKQEDTSVVAQQEDTAQETSVEEVTYETIILQLVEGNPVQETLLEGVDGAWFHDGMILAQQNEEWRIRYPNLNEWTDLRWEDAEDIVSFGIAPDDTVVLSTVSSLWTIDGITVRQSPLSELFSSPVLSMQQDDHSLWLQTTEGLFQHKNEFLRSITVADSIIDGAFVTGDVGDGFPIVWSTTDSGLVELQVQGTAIVPVSMLEESVTMVTKTSDAVWAFGDTTMWRSTGAQWSIADGILDVTNWASHPQATTLWFEDTTGSLSWVEDDSVYSTSHSGSLLGVDAAGRAIVIEEGNIVRLAPDNRVSIRNIPLMNLDKAVTISIDPMFFSDISDIQVHINSEPIDLFQNSIELIPSVFGDGRHVVEAMVEYSDGSTVMGSSSFQIGQERITWDDHISPLNVNNCLSCHAGGTNTELHTKDTWITKIELVLENVDSGTMPLGADALRSDEIALIRAWRDGGFE